MKRLSSKSDSRSVPEPVNEPLSYGRAIAARHVTISSVGALCGLGLMLAAGSAQAATITVNSNADNDGTNGNCTLREAIAAANTNLAVDACTKGDPGPAFDFVSFAPGLVSPITLGGTEIAITEQTNIIGPGASSLTISGNNASRIFNISNPASSTLISGLTLTGGKAAGNNSYGGAITSQSVLGLTNCTVSGSSAHSGGGLYSKGNATIINSTISGNTAHSGSGLFMGIGSLSLTSSTISGNTGTGLNSSGGGLFFGLLSTGASTITNSTISGNTADGTGGITAPVTPLTITNSTISGNSSAIGTSKDLTLINSTVALNASASFPAIEFYGTNFVARNSIITQPTGAACNTAITAGTNNLVTDATCGTTALVGNTPTTLALLNLGPLASNGGPTLTHALVPPSVAIDAGDSTVCNGPLVNNIDQRHFVRPAAGCDIGAFEFGAVPILEITPSSLNFGSQTIAVASTPKSVTFKNNGAGAATVIAGAVSGNPDFSVNPGTCIGPVPSGGSCTVSVTFTPQAAGARSATASFTIATSSLTYTVTATGTGALVTGGSGGGSGGGSSGSGGGSSGGGDDDGGGCTLGDGGSELGIMAGLAGLALARRRRKPQK